MSLAHTQYFLQDAQDNNNSRGDFLLDINFFSAFLYIAIYPGIIIDFTL